TRRASLAVEAHAPRARNQRATTAPSRVARPPACHEQARDDLAINSKPQLQLTAHIPDGPGPASTPPASPASAGSIPGSEVTSCGAIVGMPGMEVPSGPSMTGPVVPGEDGVTLSSPGSGDVGVGTSIET